MCLFASPLAEAADGLRPGSERGALAHRATRRADTSARTLRELSLFFIHIRINRGVRVVMDLLIRTDHMCLDLGLDEWS